MMKFLSVLISFYLMVSPLSAYAQKYQNLQVTESLKLPNETNTRALYLDSSNNIKSSSSVSQTELEYLDGLDASIMTKFSNHESDTTPHATISGASIQSPVRLDPKKDTLANLTTYAATAQNGEIVFATDTNTMYKVVSGSLSAMGGGGISNWATATAYALYDVIIQSGKIYQCASAHTSGTFATDLAANKWAEIANTIQGKAQNASSVDLTELQFPNDSLTQTASGKYLAATGNNNILKNPSFEHQTYSTDWTLTTGTPALETTIVKHGAQAYKITLSSQTLEFYQDSTRYAGQLLGTNFDRILWVNTTLSNSVFVCPRIAGAFNYSACVTVDSSGAYLPYNAIYPFGATSNGVGLVSGTMSAGVVTPGAVTGTIYVDGEAYVGETKSLFGTPIITPWTAYTPTLNNFGSTSNVSFFWRQVGSAIEVQGSFTPGTTAGSVASIGLPNSYTLDTGKISLANTTAAAGMSIGRYTTNGSDNQGDVVTATGTSTSLVYFAGAGSVRLVPLNASSMASSGNTVSIRFLVPIANLAGSTQVFASSCGANCKDELSAKGSAAGVVSDENVSDFISGNCTDATPFVCTFGTTYTVAPNCQCNLDDAGDGRCNVLTTTTTASVYTKNSGGTNTKIKFHLNCSKAGADSSTSRTIVGSFKIPEAEHTVDSGNGHGSTNTKIRRWTNVRKSVGDTVHYTYADSATLGGSWTIITPGIYTISYHDRLTSSTERLGISVNTSAPTTSVDTITYAQGLRAFTTSVSSVTGAVSWTGYLGAGDIVRCHTNGNANSGDAQSMFTLKKVSL